MDVEQGSGTGRFGRCGTADTPVSVSLVALAWIGTPIARQCASLAPDAARDLLRKLQEIVRPSAGS